MSAKKAIFNLSTNTITLLAISIASLILMLLIISTMTKHTLPESKLISFDIIESNFTKMVYKSDQENFALVKENYKDPSNPQLQFQILINEPPLQNKYECLGIREKTKYLILDFGHNSTEVGYHYSSMKEFDYLNNDLYQLFRDKKNEFLDKIGHIISVSDIYMQSDVSLEERKLKDKNSTLISFHAQNPSLLYYQANIIYNEDAGSMLLACLIANVFIEKKIDINLIPISHVSLNSHYDVLDNSYENSILIEFGNLHMGHEDFKEFSATFIFPTIANAVAEYWKP